MSASRDQSPSITGGAENAIDYMMARIEPDLNSGCWLWSLSSDTDGYGHASLPGHSSKAHRAAWQVYRGPIPDGLHVLHRCDTPACVNPGHLRLGTHFDNMADTVARGRRSPPPHAWVMRTHCARGHEITPETTYVTTRGKPECRVCRRADRSAWACARRARSLNETQGGRHD